MVGPVAAPGERLRRFVSDVAEKTETYVKPCHMRDGVLYILIFLTDLISTVRRAIIK
jgi:hypothetical protein